MALSTITVSGSAGGSPSAPVFHDQISLAGDADYPTGGSAFDVAFRTATGVKSTRTIDAVIDVNGPAGHYPVYDKANGKLMMFVRTTGVEAANHADLHATTFKLLVISH